MSDPVGRKIQGLQSRVIVDLQKVRRHELTGVRPCRGSPGPMALAWVRAVAARDKLTQWERSKHFDGFSES